MRRRNPQSGLVVFWVKLMQRGYKPVSYTHLAPFLTVFMYLNEAKDEREKKDLAMIIEETLKQRYKGVKNEGKSWSDAEK